MTVETQNSSIDYVGDGILTVYPYTFRILEDEDLKVYLDSVLFGSGNYTVSGAGDPNGGNVTFTVPPTAGVTVTLQREIAATQDIDYQPYDPFPAETQELGLDKLTMLVQQNNNELDDRVVRLPVGLPDVSTLLPVPQGGASLAWSNDGLSLVNAGLDIVVQRVNLTSTNPFGDKTGIGQAWNDAGYTVTGSMVIAFYGGVSYWLGNLDAPSSDASWEVQITVTWYQDAITYGGVVGDWALLEFLGVLDELVAGSIVFYETNTYKALYEFRAGGNVTLNPFDNTDGIDNGVGSSWINLNVYQAPVKQSTVDQFEAQIEKLNEANLSGRFDGLNTQVTGTTIQETNVGVCSSAEGLGFYVQSLFVGTGGVVTKDVALDWSLAGVGGKASSVNLADGQWLRYFALMQLAAGEGSLGWDDSPVAANLFADTGGQFTTYRQIYWNQIYANPDNAGALEIRPYKRIGNRTLWDKSLSQTYQSVNDTPVLITLDAPPNSIAQVILTPWDTFGGDQAFWRMESTDKTPVVAVTNENCHASAGFNSNDFRWESQNQMEVRVDENSQVRLHSNHSPASPLTIELIGFIYDPDQVDF